MMPSDRDHMAIILYSLFGGSGRYAMFVDWLSFSTHDFMVK